MSEEIHNQSKNRLPAVTLETVHALGGSFAERDPQAVAEELLDKLKTENPVLHQAVVALSNDCVGQHAQESFRDGAATTYALLASQITSDSMNESL